MFSTIQPHQYVAVKLPSDAVRVEQILPNTLINLGKYGSFHTNQIIGRPFHLTFEILDKSETTNGRELRIVSAAELHADALIEESAADESSTPGGENGREDPGSLGAKSNINIVDDPLNQKLTMAEIEALKQDDMGSSKELIAKIMASHSTLDQKTAFSLAKYTLRKNKKYMRRFCVLPLDVATLAEWMMNERDFAKVMEIRNEALGLMGSWANIHASGHTEDESPTADPASRYLVVDDTGGLIVATMAERMHILHPPEDATSATSSDSDQPAEADEPPYSQSHPKPHSRPKPAMSGTSDTLTLIHANTQPNLSLLRYFSFDSNNAHPTHPLYTRLKTLSWLQLLEPTSDPSYAEPEPLAPELLAKSSKRSAYYRKRRRWERTKLVVDETRAGSFNGLVIASFTSAVSILHHLVPLLSGGAQVVIYSPHVEPLVEVADLYSTARRTAFINAPDEERQVPSADFPVDPTLLLSPTVQTSRVRRWQVLPGRTHPLMMGKGGAEGYVFAATRVLPAEGKVSARGRAPRRRRIDVGGEGSGDEGYGDGRGEKRVRIEDGIADGEDSGDMEMQIEP